jgi:hypothetical protein
MACRPAGGPAIADCDRIRGRLATGAPVESNEDMRILLALLLTAASVGADEGDKAAKTTKQAAKTGGEAVRDGAVTGGRTVKAFFTGGTEAAKKEAKAGGKKTKANAKANGKKTKAAAQ